MLLNRRILNQQLRSREEAEEEYAHSRNSTIPRVFEILEGQSSILQIGLLSLRGVVGPTSLGVKKLGLPRLDVSIQIRDQSAAKTDQLSFDAIQEEDNVLFGVTHSRTEVRDSTARRRLSEATSREN